MLNKSKQSFSNQRKELKLIANTFSPLYRDFINKVISNNALKIKSFHSSFLNPNPDENVKTKLSKKQHNTIFIQTKDVRSLAHELGHAVDFWFSSSDCLSSAIEVEDNKSLKGIFLEEFIAKQEDIYNLVMEEYKNILNSNINAQAYDIFVNNIDKYRKLQNIKVNLKDEGITSKRRSLQEELYKSGFVEVFHQLVNKNLVDILNNKYSPILDALSSKYNLEYFGLSHHSLDYYQDDPESIYQEFFANCFEAKVTSNYQNFDNLIKYLPKSFAAFEKIFYIFYNHIQNDKRFNDVKTVNKEAN